MQLLHFPFVTEKLSLMDLNRLQPGLFSHMRTNKRKNCARETIKKPSVINSLTEFSGGKSGKRTIKQRLFFKSCCARRNAPN